MSDFIYSTEIIVFFFLVQLIASSRLLISFLQLCFELPFFSVMFRLFFGLEKSFFFSLCKFRYYQIPVSSCCFGNCLFQLVGIFAT